MISPQAIIDPTARIAEDVEIGPFTVIGPNVEIDSGSWVGSHVVIKGPTSIGKNNRIHQFCSLGEAPQDLKYDGEPTRLVIGEGNTFREYATVNRGTAGGHYETRVGDNNLIMAYVHIAHDCRVGNQTVFSNGASLAGHVTVADFVILSGFTLVHQFTHIGAYAFTGMGTALNRDLPPYTMASGNYARAIGINKEGLKRRGFPPEAIRALTQAFKLMIKGRDRIHAREDVQVLMDKFDDVQDFVEFVENSKRGTVR